MWIYNESVCSTAGADNHKSNSIPTEQSLPLKQKTSSAHTIESMTKPLDEPVQPQHNKGMSDTAIQVRKEDYDLGSNSAAIRGCIALVAAYLFGTALAGIMQLLCEASDLELVTYYIEHWTGMIMSGGHKAAIHFFMIQYLTIAITVTALLLMGLSAFGSVFIYLLFMLYGFGVGIINLQVLLQLPLAKAAICILLSGLFIAMIVICLCIFGASALAVSNYLQNAAFHNGKLHVSALGAHRLLGEYALLNLAFIPVCGISAVLTYFLVSAI